MVGVRVNISSEGAGFINSDDHYLTLEIDGDPKVYVRSIMTEEVSRGTRVDQFLELCHAMKWHTIGREYPERAYTLLTILKILEGVGDYHANKTK